MTGASHGIDTLQLMSFQLSLQGFRSATLESCVYP